MPPTAATPAPPAESLAKWSVEITVDPTLRAPESPEAPAGFQPVTISLAKDSNLIGRTSEKRGVFPEVALDWDDAVSHRHALLNRGDDGALVFRDVGSANGTRVNGVDLEALVDHPLKDGDTLTLGHWSRITVKASS